MQTRLPTLILAVCLSLSSGAVAQDSTANQDSLSPKKITVRNAVGYASAYYASSLVILGRTWYRDRAVVPFHFYNDNAAYLQVDKVGHVFGSYVYSYVGYRYLLRTGHTRKEALLFGATLGFVLQAPVEIMDGMHEGYGFSWGDMAANAVGSLFVLGQEALFGEQIATQKFSYGESSYARNANGYLGRTALDRLFTDYNGHTYWISVPVKRLWRDHRIPAWLNVAGGYGANGMYGEFENLLVHDGIALPETIRYRQFLLSVDVDWTRIETDSRVARAALKGLTFVKLPFPSIEYNSMGQWKAYWIYF
jgi:uncharacterized protein YfiM (DUF2279 family)